MSPSRFNQTGPKIGLSVRLAETQAEIEAAQRLRYQVFAQELGAEIESDDGRDVDPYDEHCHHLLAFDDATGEVIGCYRLITEETAKKVGGWYSEHEFDLEPLKDILPQTVELGRACTHPDYRNGGLVMLLWTGLVKFMKDENLRQYRNARRRQRCGGPVSCFERQIPRSGTMARQTTQPAQMGQHHAV